MRLTATWNQMNAPCEKLRSKKSPPFSWLIPRDIGQGYANLSSLPNSAHRELTKNICQNFIGMSVEWNKRLQFCQITGFIVFSALSENVISGQWLISLTQFRNFPLSCYHLQQVETIYGLRICSLRNWVFVLQELRLSHGWNTPRKKKSQIRQD